MPNITEADIIAVNDQLQAALGKATTIIAEQNERLGAATDMIRQQRALIVRLTASLESVNAWALQWKAAAEAPFRQRSTQRES